MAWSHGFVERLISESGRLIIVKSELEDEIARLQTKLAAANESVSILEAQVLTLRQERDAFRAELDEGAMIQALNDIWKAVDDGLGDWEYPGQIVRAVWKATDTWPKREE